MAWVTKYEDEMHESLYFQLYATLKQKVDGKISKMLADLKAYQLDMNAKMIAFQQPRDDDTEIYNKWMLEKYRHIKGTKTQVPMKEKLEMKNENSVFIKRKIRFSMKSSGDSICDAASSDEYPAFTAGEYNDPGGGVADHNTCENVEASQDTSRPACLC